MLTADGSELLVSISYASARQVVGRHLNADPIADQDANAMLAHLARNRRQYHVRAVVELNLKKSVGLLVDYHALRWNQIVFSHSVFLLKTLLSPDNGQQCFSAV